MFPSLQDFVASTFVDTKELFVIMSQHLKELPINVCLYFSENKILKKGNFWIVYLNVVNKESLIELVCDTKLKMKTYYFHNFGLHLKIYIYTT